MNESQFITALRNLPLHKGAVDLADDAAVIALGSDVFVITHDMLVEGRHFLPGQHMADVAWKLVATNLSDLAAKGTDPLGVVLGYMLGDGDADFIDGLDEVLTHYGVPLLGGDTVSGVHGSARAFGLTAIGHASHTPVPRRSGARIGDAIYVTGTLGAAMLGFEALRDGTDGDPTPYTRPMARLAEGRDLAPLATAMMDVSDGLLLDAFRMAEASEATFAIDSAAAPLAAPARVMDCLTWGDDYELLFTLPTGTFPPVPATRIGEVRPKGFAPLVLDGEPLVNADGLGYVHE
ncbi:thiamine-phosphate kinase [Erythrobacter sp. EC-HK427]|uniref:thiamine-phosphate kinase n=1 Tax=Erythrobacter sp. EC-HK427 TaxID=2038396 RepID=UPI00125C50E7|nr:thiamine-phosphate kinase [Erythrobacter sp. EC-HK427]VVT20035.1 Thiamine-monophosphate kinase [Erythrobacter sp. EC-HK427]